MEEDKFNPGAKESGGVSTTVGLLIVGIVALIAIFLIWNYSQQDQADNFDPSFIPNPMPAETKQAGTETVAEETVVDDGTPVTPTDIDNELKDMDSEINSVNSSDFGDSELSDTNIGL